MTMSRQCQVIVSCSSTTVTQAKAISRPLQVGDPATAGLHQLVRLDPEHVVAPAATHTTVHDPGRIATDPGR